MSYTVGGQGPTAADDDDGGGKDDLSFLHHGPRHVTHPAGCKRPINEVVVKERSCRTKHKKLQWGRDVSLSFQHSDLQSYLFRRWPYIVMFFDSTRPGSTRSSALLVDCCGYGKPLIKLQSAKI